MLSASAPTSTAAAGFVVARMLLAVPEAVLLDRFADRAGRGSWPLRNPVGIAALRLLDGGFSPDAVRAEWPSLITGTGAVELHESARLGLDPALLRAELEEHYSSVGLTREHAPGVAADHLGKQLLCLAHQSAALVRLEGAERVAAVARLVEFRTAHPDRFCADVVAELRVRGRTRLAVALPGLIECVLQGLDAWAFDSAPALHD